MHANLRVQRTRKQKEQFSEESFCKLNHLRSFWELLGTAHVLEYYPLLVLHIPSPVPLATSSCQCHSIFFPKSKRSTNHVGVVPRPAPRTRWCPPLRGVFRKNVLFRGRNSPPHVVGVRWCPRLRASVLPLYDCRCLCWQEFQGTSFYVQWSLQVSLFVIVSIVGCIYSRTLKRQPYCPCDRQHKTKRGSY